MLTTEVLIDDRFPFSIFSKIAMQRERSDTITKTMEKGKWTFVGANKTEILQARQLMPNSELYFINGISDVRNAPRGELPENQDDFARAQQGAERIMHLLAAPEVTTVEVMTVKAGPARDARDTGPATVDSKAKAAKPVQPAPRKI